MLVDAFGGLKGRKELTEAASTLNIPLVTAGVAGKSGYIATVLPNDPSPANFFGENGATESTLGTPAPAVALAAALQVDEVLSILCGNGPKLAGKMLLFDTTYMTFETVTL